MAYEYVRERRARIGMEADAIEFEAVEFDFLELWEFFVKVFAATLDDPEHRGRVDHLDIDEVANRVTVALTARGAVEDVTAAILARGVPEAAFVVTVVPPSKPRQADDVRNTFDRRPGGVEIDAIGKGACTFWLSSRIDGDAVFSSASHCSTDSFSPDAGEWFQDATGPQIGNEAWDWAGSTGYVYGGGSGLPNVVCNNPCRYSDFQYGIYDDSTDALHGRIARTQAVGYLSPGSFTLDSARPYWGITGRLLNSNQPVGRWLSKVGRTSGWTRGQITHTCQWIQTGNTSLICHHRTNIWSEPGDSGSPIFYEGGTGSGDSPWDWVYLAGILWGGPEGNFEETVFGTMEGIDRDLERGLGISVNIQLGCAQGADTIFPCTPPPDPLDVTINGPTEVPPDETCYYYSSVTGGDGNYSYTWRKDGVLIGSSYDVTVSTGSSSFVLSLSVEDSAGAVGSDELSVQVDPQAFMCFQ